MLTKLIFTTAAAGALVAGLSAAPALASAEPGRAAQTAPATDTRPCRHYDYWCYHHGHHYGHYYGHHYGHYYGHRYYRH
ncbi:hypothetical protein AB0L06_30535 [Spirillospora sp. NPDC052269]